MTKSRPRRNQEGGAAGTRDKPVTQALHGVLNSGAIDHFRARTVADLIALRLVQRALDGDLEAMKEITDRTEGRIPQARALEPKDRDFSVRIIHVGGEQAYNRALREFEEANGKIPNCKTN